MTDIYFPTTKTVRCIKQGEPNFAIVDGLYMVPRASFAISDNCPENYKSILWTCISKGWLKPVAHVKDAELMWEELQK